MTSRLFKSLLLLVPAGLFLTGCQTLEERGAQPVAVRSFPAGATVLVQGEVVGVTPTTVNLARTKPHRLVLEKEGYKTSVAEVAPVPNERGGMVKFGPLVQTGYYENLSPDPVRLNLVPDILPASRGPDAYGEMMTLIATIDGRREAGELDPVEHKYMVEQIIEFYTQ